MRRRFWALAVLALLIYAVIAITSSGGIKPPPPARDAAGAGPNPGAPFAYRAADATAFTRRVTLGESQVLFTLSPGGVMATAARVAAFRGLIDKAVKGTNIPANLLEGLVFLESAGRPQVIAGNSASDAAGLTQILASTGKQMLALKIDLPRSERLTGQIATAQAAGNTRRVAELEQQRAKIDQRFDPAQALAATVRYLRTAEASLGGRADLAVAAYHAGIGNLEQILDLYDGGRAVPYVQLYFDSSPTSNAAAYRALIGLTDDGSLYYWRVLAAERIMRLWRTDRAALKRWVSESTGYPSTALTLVSTGPADSFATPAQVGDAYWAKPHAQLQPLPRNAGALRLEYAPSIGALATKLGAPKAIYRGLRPVAVRMLIQMVAWVDQIAKTKAPLIVASAVQDPEYSALQGFSDDPPAATGYTFEIERYYATEAQREAFQFVLDRLQDLNLIAWLRGSTQIEITVAPDAGSVIAHGIRN